MIKNSELFFKVTQLRKAGASYQEINKKFGVSKSTLSYWFHNKSWSENIRKDLQEQGRAKQALKIQYLNKLRYEYKLIRYEKYRNEARLEFHTLKNNKLFLIGISLYWGEGEKINKGRVSVINSDENMMRIVSLFYRNILRISDNKLRAALFLYEDMNENLLKQYWSKITHIPLHQFIKTQFLHSRSTLTKRKVSHGMCTVYFSDTKTNIKIKEWIRLLSNDMRV